MKLIEIYQSGDLDDETEAIWNFLPAEEDMDLIDFGTRTIGADELGTLLMPDGMTPVLEAFEDFAEDEQRELVGWKMANFDEDRVLVVNGLCVLDGQHHLVAAHRLGREVTVLDLEAPLSGPWEAPGF